MCLKFSLLLLVTWSFKCESVKILAYYPTPSISHRVVFRKLNIELINQGHDVTVITTDPAFPKTDAPKNLTEIDVHDISYELMHNMKKLMPKDEVPTWNVHDVNMFYLSLFETQIKTPEVKKHIFDKRTQFDLILVEEISRPSLAISHVFNAPVILFSSFSGLTETHDIFGSHTHPLLYPSPFYNRLYDLTFWEKLKRLYEHYSSLRTAGSHEDQENKILQKYFGPEIPPVRELYKNVHMVFLNIHSIWIDNQPVPPNVVYLGGFHQSETKELPQDLQTILNTSKHGVIYVSFGTNALSALLPTDKVEIIAKVLGQLPYDVLWKWDKDELPGQAKNIKLSNWFPQADLLKHKNVKLFITQAGLQSTDEAITAGVPLIAFPVLGDQWYNAEKYVRHGIGKKILFEEVTEDVVNNAVVTVIEDESYRNNIIKLREVMQDQPQTPTERAIFWVEHVIRHKGAKHLRAASANLSWAQYFEIEVLLYLLLLILLLSILLSLGVFYSYKYLCNTLYYYGTHKLKQS